MNEAILVAACALLLMAVFYFRGKAKFQQNEVSRAEDVAQRRVEEVISELECDQRRTHEIIERMSEGVVVLDGSFVPLKVNMSARRLLGLRKGPLPSRIGSEEVLAVARRAQAEGRATHETISLWPELTTVKVQALPLEAQGGVALVFQDITEELTTLRIRRQFVANASHELKSPVAGLQALAEAIRLAVEDDPATAERFSEKLVVEADRLGRLISDLLDLSRLEDPTNLSNRRMDLSRVAHTQFEETKPQARLKRIVFEESVQPDLCVKGDDQQLGLMIRNLLDNAIRYTPDGGSVSAQVFKEGDDAILKVSDTGIGIPLEAQSRIFERFYRVDKDRSRDRGGTGLGLSIVKHVVELHGGHLALESELGIGSTFTVRLPTSAPGKRYMESVAS